MKNYVETICDDNGFEILVDYDAEKSGSAFNYDEPGVMVYTELKLVEIIIAGRGINLLPVLHENEKEFIISKLTYDN